MDDSPKKQSAYSQLVNSLIKHPRYQYNDRRLNCTFPVGEELYTGIEFEVAYKPNVNLVLSVITRLSERECQGMAKQTNPQSYFPRPHGQRNCLLYNHTHQGSRMEGSYLIEFLANYETSLVVFDFAGAGKSQGEYTSFGWFEADQINTVVNFLSHSLGFDNIGLWGKSMGGAASIIYQSKYPNPLVKFMIIDSAFDKLKHAILNIASSHSAAPSFAVRALLLFVSNTVKTKAGFDIYKVKPIDYVKNIGIPCIFVIGQEDNVVTKSQFFNLHSSCKASYKKLYVVPGDHTGNRLDDDQFCGEVANFMTNFFPMRNPGGVAGVLKNRNASISLLTNSQAVSHTKSTVFDATKIKNSMFIPSNARFRQGGQAYNHAQIEVPEVSEYSSSPEADHHRRIPLLRTLI